MAVVEDPDDGPGREMAGQQGEPGPQGGLAHVRPPEPGEGRIATRRHALEREGIGLPEIDAAPGVRLLAGDLEHRFVDVGGATCASRS